MFTVAYFCVQVDVTVAGLTGAGPLALSRNVLVVAEKSLQDALTSAPFDVVILPGGGKGSEAFVNVIIEKAIAFIELNEKINYKVFMVCSLKKSEPFFGSKKRLDA